MEDLWRRTCVLNQQLSRIFILQLPIMVFHLKMFFFYLNNHALVLDLLLWFSHSLVSESLQPHGPQHARPPCPSVSHGVCSNSSYPSSWWCHLTISSSAALFSHPQSFPALGSFPVNWLFTSGGQSIGASASTSVLTMNIQDWFPLGLPLFLVMQVVICAVQSAYPLPLAMVTQDEPMKVLPKMVCHNC